MARCKTCKKSISPVFSLELDGWHFCDAACRLKYITEKVALVRCAVTRYRTASNRRRTWRGPIARFNGR